MFGSRITKLLKIYDNRLYKISDRLVSRAEIYYLDYNRGKFLSTESIGCELDIKKVIESEFYGISKYKLNQSILKSKFSSNFPYYDHVNDLVYNSSYFKKISKEPIYQIDSNIYELDNIFLLDIFYKEDYDSLKEIEDLINATLELEGSLSEENIDYINKSNLNLINQINKKKLFSIISAVNNNCAIFLEKNEKDILTNSYLYLDTDERYKCGLKKLNIFELSDAKKKEVLYNQIQILKNNQYAYMDEKRKNKL